MAHHVFFRKLGVSPDALTGTSAAYTAILAQVHPRYFMERELACADDCLFDYTRTRDFYDMDCLIACISEHADDLVERLKRVPLFCDFMAAFRSDIRPVVVLLLFMKGFMLKRGAPVQIEDGATFKPTIGDVLLSKKEKMAVAEMYNGDRFGEEDFAKVFGALFCNGQIDRE